MLNWGGRGTTTLFMGQLMMYFCKGYCKRTSFSFEDEFFKHIMIYDSHGCSVK